MGWCRILEGGLRAIAMVVALVTFSVFTMGITHIAHAQGVGQANQLPKWCIPDNPPEINIIPTTQDVKFEYNRNSNQLGQFDIAHSPYKPGTKTIVKGLHSGKIKFRSELKVESKANSKTGIMCMYYKSITVRFHIDPTIYITNAHKPGTCEHAAIQEHELKHLMVDREVVNEFSNYIGQALHQDLNANGYIWGPFPSVEAQDTFAEMKQVLNDIVKPLIDDISAERQKRQAAIDTIEEYERVSNQCK